MMVKKKSKPRKIEIDFDQHEECLVGQAASILNTDVSSFVRQQAIKSAETIIHEQTRFVVSEQQWVLIEAALERPAKVLTGLQNKLAHFDEWD